MGEWASESTASLSRLATSYLAVNKAVAGSVQHAKPLCEHGEHGRLWRGVQRHEHLQERTGRGMEERVEWSGVEWSACRNRAAF
jgi:hypothetical protein